MHYALLIHELPESRDGFSAEDREALTGEYMAIAREDRVTSGAHLQPAHTATTVRERDGQFVLTDGPFAETREVFAGYFLVEAPDLDVALEIARRIPAVRMGGSVEVRPLQELPA
jgi:hypothetical protein